MGYFIQYLEASQQAVETKCGKSVDFYWGEYSPDIRNFHYHYVFGITEGAYKVTVDIFKEGSKPKLLVRPWPSSFKEYLEPISLPVGYSLMSAYEHAVAKGYKPNLNGAVVFLENEIKSGLGPGYWFLSEGDSGEWIFVSIQGEHRIVITRVQPFSV